MSYTYSQLHDIIEIQYRKTANNDNWFWEETFKFGKGYTTPSNYLNNVVNKISETAKSLDNTEIDEPLYLHI